MFQHRTRQAGPRRGNQGRLQLEQLEERAMLSAVPAYNSLSGAPNSLYLDFNGDFQPYWYRSDAGQVYQNIVAGEYNKDNTAGFSQSELNDIRDIWQAVADDYAPFNVNVTTVEPAAAEFTTNSAMRVVIGGNYSAMLVDPHMVGNAFMPYTFLVGDRFTTNDHGASLSFNAGYSTVGSYTSAEPNVVFVFAKAIRTWGNVDHEGHAQNYNLAIANAASHEAGHTFGLVHHSTADFYGNFTEYDRGDFMTTPIMGDNSSTDRTTWSYVNYEYARQRVTQDSVQVLTQVLGARADDHGNTYQTASKVLLFNTGDIVRSYYDLGVASGVISTTSDVDWFQFTTSGGSLHINVDPVKYGNLDVRVELYQRMTLYNTLIATADPTLTAPYTGVNAAIDRVLGAGTYLVAVRSHGTYGDLGQYGLSIIRMTNYTVPQPPVVIPPFDPWSNPTYVTQTPGLGGGAYGVVAPARLSGGTAPTNDLAFASGGPSTTSVVSKKAKEKATDAVFAGWE